MRSSGSADRLALDRDLPTTAVDVAALRRVRRPTPVALEVYLRLLASFQAPAVAMLRARRGPGGPPFTLAG